jgi:hypothetical protein
MKRNWLNTSLIMAGTWLGSVCCAYAQQNDNGQFYDPDRHKLIPDKVFEIGLPLLFLFLLANAIVTIIKIRAENRLREKILDKQVSEEAMLTLFTKEPANKYVYLKWFLILAAIGISFIMLRMLAFAPGMDQGYMSMGVIALNLSLAFLIYYIIINKKEA